jgi:hypothetical protein
LSKNFLHQRQPHRILYREIVEPTANSYEIGQSRTYKSHVKPAFKGHGGEIKKIHVVEAEIYNNQELN